MAYQAITAEPWPFALPLCESLRIVMTTPRPPMKNGIGLLYGDVQNDSCPA